jgi:hypothetical protein
MCASSRTSAQRPQRWNFLDDHMNASVGLKPRLKIKLYRIRQETAPITAQCRALWLFTAVVDLIQRGSAPRLRDRHREDALFICETR